VIDTWKGNRSKIAALATTVTEAADAGDEVCKRILSAAVDELVLLIETTRTLIEFTDEESVPVSYSGGMFKHQGYLDLFVTAMQNAPARYDLQTPRLDPAVGAALYAAKRSGNPLSAAAIQQLSENQSTR
jgi:N-acetylglucosamine kinase-like BadF-type ATPase